MDAIINMIQNIQECYTSGKHVQLKDLVTRSFDFFSSNSTQLDNVLNSLDIPENTSAILSVLYAKIKRLSPTVLYNADPLFQYIEKFTISSDTEQIKLFPAMYVELYRTYSDNMIKISKAHRGIFTVREAIRKLQQSDKHLTSLHGEFIRMCLHAKNLKPAVEVLNIDITRLCNERPFFNEKCFLMYYYYGGLVYTIMKNYERAIYFFEICITVPGSSVVSKITLEAYKKYVLVLLVMEGYYTCHVKDTPKMQYNLLPKHTSQIVARYIKPKCQLYLDISNAFQVNDSNKISEILNTYQLQFRTDGNYGLAKLALFALRKQRINALTKTYEIVPLAAVKAKTSLQNVHEAEKYVFKMNVDGELRARIDQKNKLVAFHNETKRFNTLKEIKEIDSKIAECIKIYRDVDCLDDEISVNPNYIKKQMGIAFDDDHNNQKHKSYNQLT